MPWRSVFTDPQLQTLIEMGLQHNTDLLNAALNVKAVEAQLMAAKLSFLPSFTFTPQGTIASWDGNKATKTYQLPISASWDVEFIWKAFKSKKKVHKWLFLLQKTTK